MARLRGYLSQFDIVAPIERFDEVHHTHMHQMPHAHMPHAHATCHMHMPHATCTCHMPHAPQRFDEVPCLSSWPHAWHDAE